MSTFEEVDVEVIKLCCRLRSQFGKSLEEFMFVLEFVLRESFNNAVEHGNKMKNSEKVKYEISISKEGLTLDFWDSGEGFDLEEVLKHSDKEASLQIRNRGLQAIITFGFLITVDRGHIRLKHKMEKVALF